jgi:hypothetical protein
MAKLIKLEADNFKRLRAVEIRPAESGITVVAGRNGQGKSSVLDAIQAALGGKRAAPAEPVRRGTDCATVVCELDDLIIRRTFTPGGGAALTVTPRDGSRELRSPQAVLDKLYGALTFDPLAFLRMSPRDRLGAVLELGGPEVLKLEERRASLRSQRADLVKQSKQASAAAAAMPVFPDAPPESVSVSDLNAAIQQERAWQDKAAELGTAKLRASNERLRWESKAKELEAEAVRMRAEIEQRLQDARSALEMAARCASEEQGFAQAYENATTVDHAAIAASLAAQIDNVHTLNQQVSANRAAAAAKTKARDLEDGAADFDRDLEAVDTQRRALLAQALRAVPGMDIGPDGVLLAGLPFEQAATSEQLRAALGIGIAANPDLRLLLIREGSLLDADALAEVARVAESHDVQVLIERVGDAGAGAFGGIGVVIEDGSVTEEWDAPELPPVGAMGHGHD